VNRAILQAMRDEDCAGLEWRELTCQEYEDAVSQGGVVASSITDPDGFYGSPLTYTLWLLSTGDYLATALEGRRDSHERKCSHALGSAGQKETP
jgi:hypothetical protein